MKQNVGNGDRIIRILLAALFAYLFFSSTVTGTFGLIVIILGGVFLLTGLIGLCPIYGLFGISTCPERKHN